MPLLTEIFWNAVKDLKRGQCSHIKPIDTPPFVRRCPSPVAKGLRVCLRHSKSVTFMTNGNRETAYFNDIRHAERFRKSVGSLWLETNYDVPK